MTPLASLAGDAAWAALAFFLAAMGIAVGYAFVRLGGTLGRLSSLIKGAENELLPVINKVGGTVDRVNSQLEKVDAITDSAVDAADSVDTAVRAVSFAIKRPVQKVSGFAAGISHAFADFRVRHDVRGAVDAGKVAAARREQELEDELRDAGREGT